MNFSSYQKNVWKQSFPELTLDDYASLKKNYVSLHVRIGTVIARKIEVGITMPFLMILLIPASNTVWIILQSMPGSATISIKDSALKLRQRDRQSVYLVEEIGKSIR